MPLIDRLGNDVLYSGYFGACNEDEMMLALVKYGPLAVGIEVYDDFMVYKKGIYHHTGLTDAVNHLEVLRKLILLVVLYLLYFMTI